MNNPVMYEDKSGYKFKPQMSEEAEEEYNESMSGARSRSAVDIDESYSKVVTIGFDASAAIIFGASFEGGIVLDTKDGVNMGLYFTPEFLVGVDASIGGKIEFSGSENSDMVASDLDGLGGDLTISAVGGDFNFGGNIHNRNGSWMSEYLSVGLGLSAGSPLGATFGVGPTITTPTLNIYSDEE